MFSTLPAIQKNALMIAISVCITACGSLQPKALDDQELRAQTQADRVTAVAKVGSISAPMTLEEAMARALKYNLDNRVRMMEEALAMGQLDVSRFDLLPKLTAQAGYTSRNNDKISQSRNAEDGTLSKSQFISQERSHTASSLVMSWSMLDLGVSYYSAKQQADRVLIATERRRKAMHTLMQDVRTAYWRAASAQKLQGEVQQTIKLGEEALASSRRTEEERLRNPIDALRYQRQLLENLRLLEGINNELSTAKTELASLINAPLAQPLVLAPTEFSVNRQILQTPIDVMEEIALLANPELREQHYNARIARDESRKSLVRLFPGISLNYGLNYDTDRYLVNRNWSEAGAQISFNLFNLLSAPTQMKLARAGIALADQRRVAVQMAVLTQVHIARQQLDNAISQFERANAIWETDQKISEHIRNRADHQAQSKLDLISNQTASILSLLRRYQALAQVQGAEARLHATLGNEARIASLSETSLADLIKDLQNASERWRQGTILVMKQP